MSTMTHEITKIARDAAGTVPLADRVAALGAAGVDWRGTEKPKVRVTTFCEYGDDDVTEWVGEVYLHEVDMNDEFRTFLVRQTSERSGGGIWVYAVAPPIVDESGTADPEQPLFGYLDGKKKGEQIDALQKHVIDLRESLSMAEGQIVELQGRAESFRLGKQIAVNELVGFKQQVRDKAIEVAEEQGWCDDGLNSVLEELGLEPKEYPEVEITVQVEYKITARPTSRSLDDLSSTFIADSLSVDTDSIGLDSDDWDDVNVEVDSMDVANWERA